MSTIRFARIHARLYIERIGIHTHNEIVFFFYFFQLRLKTVW